MGLKVCWMVGVREMRVVDPVPQRDLCGTSCVGRGGMLGGSGAASVQPLLLLAVAFP